MMIKALLASLNCFSMAGSTMAPFSEVILGHVRVQALSPTLVRVEPKGPRGFEDRTTFMVANRTFRGIPLTTRWVPHGTVVSTTYYSVLLKNDTNPRCSPGTTSTDVVGPIRSFQFPDGTRVRDNAGCCDACEKDPTCVAWVHAADIKMCYPLSAFSSTTPGEGTSRHFGYRLPRVSFQVRGPGGALLYDAAAGASAPQNLLHWPAPMEQRAYTVADYPRFFVPSWGVMPAPEGAAMDPAARETNGYDFGNNVEGDTYVFLLGSTLKSWEAARAEFLLLSGPVPVLPDFAYGTWFTWWHAYTEAEAKEDVAHWEASKLPIDVWGLDINWRHTSRDQDRSYDHPDTGLFPDFDEWFAFLRRHKLRCFFNDHPYPVAARAAGGTQTSPEETRYRWAGLTGWMRRGLAFWWYDTNWKFSIPPPFDDTANLARNWLGLDTASWGAHVYFSIAEQFRKTARAGDEWSDQRPMVLTKFARDDARPGRLNPKGSRYHPESPAHHRYPVWWTGDFVTLQASVESMVDAGVYDLKPFVHSDCGGDKRGTAGDLLRWTAHCTFGTIVRFHGADHRPWTYGPEAEGVIRSYLQIRYRLAPSLIAAGRRATETGFPLVARCDLYWPEHRQHSASNHQYVFLEDLLVAPIFEEGPAGGATRSVWIPPGDWQDAWGGAVVRGPTTVESTQPCERQPMWYRRDGGLLVLADSPDAPSTRIEDQDWSLITLEVFPAASFYRTRRSLFDRRTAARTDIVLNSDGAGNARIFIGKATDGASRAWLARIHLRQGQRIVEAMVDGWAVPLGEIVHVYPGDRNLRAGGVAYPLGGAGSLPAPNAGPIVELRIASSASPRTVDVLVVTAPPVTAEPGKTLESNYVVAAGGGGTLLLVGALLQWAHHLCKGAALAPRSTPLARGLGAAE